MKKTTYFMFAFCLAALCAYGGTAIAPGIKPPETPLEVFAYPSAIEYTERNSVLMMKSGLKKSIIGADGNTKIYDGSNLSEIIQYYKNEVLPLLEARGTEGTPRYEDGWYWSGAYGDGNPLVIEIRRGFGTEYIIAITNGEREDSLNWKSYGYTESKVFKKLLDSDANEMSESEIVLLADYLMYKGNSAFWWFNSDFSNDLGMEIEGEAQKIDGGFYDKVARFGTLTEIKTAAQSIFTSNFCEAHLFDKVEYDQKFIDYKGALFHNSMTGGMGWIFSLPKHYDIIAVTDDSILLNAICDGLDRDGDTGDIAEYKFEVTLQNTNVGWRLNNYYNFIPEGLTEELPKCNNS